MVDTVWALVEADDSLNDCVRYAVLAALEGDAELEAQLDGSSPSPANPREHESTSLPPTGAFIESIEVQGFRGIGPHARLQLHPGPGLTVISGRNGSGKSSFAEALEFALTRQSYRWLKKPKHWADTWRNLHEGNGTQVRVRLAVEGGEPTVVGVDWSPGGDLNSADVWTQVGNLPRQHGTDGLGWTDAVELHRPILTYEEIGGLLRENPSVLHDALAQLLGLDEIQDAEARLTAAVKSAKQPRHEADSALRTLKATISASDDTRAVTVFKGLRKPYKLDAIETVLTDSDATDGPQALLRRLLELTAPDQSSVEAAATAVDDAKTIAAALADNALEALAAKADVLGRVLVYRRHADDDRCPVCEVTTLGPQWDDRAAESIAAATQQLQDYRSSRAVLANAHEAGQRLVEALSVVPDDIEGIDPALLQAHNEAVVRATSVDGDLATHLRTKVAGVAMHLDALQAAAREVLASRDNSWRPLASQIAVWVALERSAQRHDDRLAVVTQAKNWVTTNAQLLRNQRLEPIAGQARAIWSRLRQESNVDIGSITLEGKSTNRRVQLSGAVDGQPAGALSVMSQGELHALALALFLPRATTNISPFRFIVLDDPIQAMDPAKIDGFLQVLVELSEDRQVIVFSHDDRLATAVRNSQTHAYLVEVIREAGSKVVVKESQNPALRYVDDVFAVVVDKNVPDDVKRRAIPALFRQAVEAAAQQRFFARAFAAGVQRAELEDRWSAAHTTRARIALAVHDDPSSDVSGWLSYRPGRQPTLGICNAGSHRGANAVPTRDTVNDLRWMVTDLLGA